MWTVLGLYKCLSEQSPLGLGGGECKDLATSPAPSSSSLYAEE